MTDRRNLLDRLNAWQSRWWRIWALWAAIYAAGFIVLALVDPAAGWPYYTWAIGWALVKGFWDRVESRRLLKDVTEDDKK